MTALSCWNGRTSIFTSTCEETQGLELATCCRASCTFPVLFQPVYIAAVTPVIKASFTPGYHIDGGVHDNYGWMALPALDPNTPSIELPTLPVDLHSRTSTTDADGDNTLPRSSTNLHPRTDDHLHTCDLDDYTKELLMKDVPIIVNILFDNASFDESKIPDIHKHCVVLSIVINDIPNVNPVNSLQLDGCVAFRYYYLVVVVFFVWRNNRMM